MMVRWMWLVCAAATVWVAGAAYAGPFDVLPQGHPVYANLAVVNRAGLLPGSSYTPGVPITRTECALVVKDTWQALQPLLKPNQRVAQPDRGVQAFAVAMVRLLDALRPELAVLGVDVAGARDKVADLPATVPSLDSLTRSLPSSIHSMGGAPSPRPNFGPHAGPTLPAAAAPAVFQPGGADGSVVHDPLGASGMLTGHVLAADLRLQMGDTSVLFEYGQSLFDHRLGGLLGGEEGAKLRTGFLAALNDRLSVDVGYGRLTGDYRSFTTLTPQPSDGNLVGVQAGLNYHGPRWLVSGLAAIYAPEGRTGGYFNQLGTEVTYRANDSLSVGVGYQGSARRSLASFEDAWRDFFNARVVYALNSSLRADLTYRFDTGEQRGAITTPGSSEHFGGISMSVGF